MLWELLYILSAYIAVASFAVLAQPAVAYGANTTLPLAYPAQVLQGDGSQTCPSEVQRRITRSEVKNNTGLLIVYSCHSYTSLHTAMRCMWDYTEVCRNGPLMMSHTLPRHATLKLVGPQQPKGKNHQDNGGYRKDDGIATNGKNHKCELHLVFPVQC